jgi:hypothetical protein
VQQGTKRARREMQGTERMGTVVVITMVRVLLGRRRRRRRCSTLTARPTTKEPLT